MDSWIHLPLSKTEVLQALKQAVEHDFIDNLRSRHANVALDSKVRGYVGEIAFSKWLQKNQIKIAESNRMEEGSSMDIDFLIQREKANLHLELKTSLIPDVDETFENVARKRDIKLIRRSNQSVENLKGDVHVQIFFKQLRIRKDEWLKKQNINDSASLDNIYEKIAAFRYETDTYLAAWIDKKTLIKQILHKNPHLQKWKYGQREFWCCNLENEAKKPLELLSYLKEEV